jgi:hypothetical protein
MLTLAFRNFVNAPKINLHRFRQVVQFLQLQPLEVADANQASWYRSSFFYFRKSMVNNYASYMM